MEKISSMTKIFEKLGDMKRLFQYGQKIVPILQSLVDFMQETVPLLETINHSIADSTSKIPKATNQISDVTSATELATTEILDLVDLISSTLKTIEKMLKNLKDAETRKYNFILELKEVVKDNEQALDLIKKYESSNNASAEIDKTLLYFPQLQDDTYKITLSLQIQDITSQQLAAVTHLIESVQQKLASLIIDIDDAKLKEVEVIGIKAPEGASFDPDASYIGSGKRQDAADDLIRSHKASQDEIDKLFS